MSSKQDKIVVAMATVMIAILLFNIAATPVLSMVKEYDKQLILETTYTKTIRPVGTVSWFKSGYSHDGEVTTYTIMHKDYIGMYFITAYCPSECGYNGENYPAGWTTASGEICHRADWEYRLWEPTTWQNWATLQRLTLTSLLTLERTISASSNPDVTGCFVLLITVPLIYLPRL